MQRNLTALTERVFDLVVVGGGVTGAAIAWDGAQRGLSVALVERGDFGAATSANSLKVVHGGIRYLQHLDVPRVRESCRERSTWLRIAPHLVRPLPVLVPAFGHGMRGPEALGAAFAMLEVLTFDRNRQLSDAARRIPRARLVSRSEVRERCPELGGPDLTGGGLFWDGQLENPPRIVWELVRTAGQAGAAASNHCEVTAFLRRNGRIEGVSVRDRLGGERFDVRGRLVVNAAGPFAEQLYLRDGLRSARQAPLSRDMALVLRRPLVRGQAVAVQTGYRDPDALLSRGLATCLSFRGDRSPSSASTVWYTKGTRTSSRPARPRSKDSCRRSTKRCPSGGCPAPMCRSCTPACSRSRADRSGTPT